MVEDVRINKGELLGQWNFRASTKVSVHPLFGGSIMGGKGRGVVSLAIGLT